MTIDIRQEITCSAGPLISATIADDYVSQSGLITTRGEAQIAGGSSAVLGGSITFTGVPRSLRVIGLSYSPLDNVTYVQFTCPLGQALGAQDVDFKRRIQEGTPPAKEWASTNSIPFVTVNSILQRCCSGMGLAGSLSVNTGADRVFLTGGEEYEFTGPYSSVLSSILAAYGHCGAYFNGGIVSRPLLSPFAGGQWLLTEENLIRTGPLGAGIPPAGRITMAVPFNGLHQINRPRFYGKETCTTTELEGATRSIFYSYIEDPTILDAEPIDDSLSYTYAPFTRTCTTVNDKNQNILTVETTTATGALDNYASNLAAARFDAAAASAAGRACTTKTTTTRTFDIAGHVVLEEVEVVQEVAALASSLTLPFARPAELQSDGVTVKPANRIYAVPGSAARFVAERIERRVEVAFKDLRITTRRWRCAGYTPEGQQAAAEGAKDTLSGSRIASIVAQAQRLVEQPAEVQLLIGAAEQWLAEIKEAEEAADRIGSATTTYRVEPTNERVSYLGVPGLGDVSLSLPFAPDTRNVIKYTTVDQEGNEKSREAPVGLAEPVVAANRFMRDYQALATAMRFGINVQVPLDLAPAQVTQLYQVRLRNTVGVYLATGTTFQLGPQGGICSMDLLYLGGAGSSNTDMWLPAVSTELPPLPPTIMDPITGDTVYDLTDVVLVPPIQPPTPEFEAGILFGIRAFSFSGPLDLATEAEPGLGLGVAVTGSITGAATGIGFGIALD